MNKKLAVKVLMVLIGYKFLSRTAAGSRVLEQETRKSSRLGFSSILNLDGVTEFYGSHEDVIIENTLP